MTISYSMPNFATPSQTSTIIYVDIQTIFYQSIIEFNLLEVSYCRISAILPTADIQTGSKSGRIFSDDTIVGKVAHPLAYVVAR